MTQARAAARDCDARAGAAVTGLRDLGMSRAETAQITGLSEREGR